MNAWKIADVQQGLRLRQLGLSYGSIAVVLREYHDFYVTEGGVRRQLRKHGAAPHPRGCTANVIGGGSPLASAGRWGTPKEDESWAS